MQLFELLKSVAGKHRYISVNGICFDSRIIKKKDIFFAITGSKTSGTKFIREAYARGASIIVCDRKFVVKNFEGPLLKVENVRKCLSEACSNFYKKKPSFIIAVTGTNGKTSVANFFFQILNLNKVPAATIGTLGIFSKKYIKKTNLTSIDPLLLHKSLEILKKKKINNVILEASSHGLDQSRLDNLNFKVGIFTNLSHDHLDYHKNMKSYLASKMYLFKKLLNKNSKVITDEENKQYKVIKKIINKKKLKNITIGTKVGNLRILNHKYVNNLQIIKISIRSKIYSIQIPLIGYFQIKNLLMAVLAAISCGINRNKIFKIIHKIKPVTGRLECVENLENGSYIIVDFAHTPDALEQSLLALKKQFKKKIVLVFGCGGERDKKKRSLMGKIAKKYCRKIFITDDNPRNENPKKIRNAIIKNCKKSAVDIGNRAKAIKTAINELRSNEILLVAGKGHETTQDYGKKITKFSDQKVIKEIIKKRKFIYEKNNFNYLNYDGVSINSKTVKKNNLFFAIKGKNNDGHRFVKEAFKRGAIKSVVSKKIKKVPNNKLIKVKNTFLSLNRLAQITRNNSSAQIIGITGSAGKTTLKDLVSFALSHYGKVYSSPHSYNNEFGVPLSLSNLKSNIDYGVFEIGMSKVGEINKLSKIVRPNIGLITNISEAHLENFSNLKGIARAKSELIENISEKENIILNRDDKFFKFLNKKSIQKKLKVTSFSLESHSDIYLKSIKKINNIYKLKINVNGKNYYFNTKFIFSNYIKNILACISILSILKLNLYKLKNKFVHFRIPEGRGNIIKVKKFNKKFSFIDESYNANPLSVNSAIDNLNSLKKRKNQKKILFLGDMLELGQNSKQLHKSLSKKINNSDIDKVFVYGKYSKETYNFLIKRKKGQIFKSLNQASKSFNNIVSNNDILMIKGSNATGLNKFSKTIKRGQTGAI